MFPWRRASRECTIPGGFALRTSDDCNIKGNAALLAALSLDALWQGGCLRLPAAATGGFMALPESSWWDWRDSRGLATRYKGVEEGRSH